MSNKTLMSIILIAIVVLVIFMALFVHSYKDYDYDNPCQIECNGWESSEYCYSGRDTCVNICVGNVVNPCE